MNDAFAPRVADSLFADLQAFARVCEQLLSLARNEHLALAGRGGLDGKPLPHGRGSVAGNTAVFDEKRKELLPDIESLVKKFRRHRMAWQQISEARRQEFTELRQLFQNIQGLVMKILALDRENQQAMLKRGLVPVKNLPAAAAQQPHFVADLYRRNSSA